MAWDKSTPWLPGQAQAAALGLMKEPLHKLWNPTGATPALFLNTTSVAAGSRVTIGPLHLTQTSTALHLNTALCAPHDGRGAIVDLPLATGISLSARFPWLTPAGWFDLANSECADKHERDRVYLVDGGYFENSGLETAIDIATYMRATLSGPQYARRFGVDTDALRREFPHGVEIRIVMIFAIDGAASRYIKSSAERSGDRPGEIMPPIQAMLAGRAARTRAVHLNAIEEGNLPYASSTSQLERYEIDPTGNVRFGQDILHQVWLDGQKFFLPLGWRLSERSLEKIAQSADGAAAQKLIQHELEGKDTSELKRRKK